MDTRFTQLVTRKAGPITGEELEPGMLVRARTDGREFTDRVQGIGHGGVTLGEKPGVAIMTTHETTTYELLEDYAERLIPVGTCAIGPDRHVPGASPRWWVWTWRRTWAAIPGPKGWDGTSPLPAEDQLEPATLTGAQELTGMAMIYTRTGTPALAMLWGTAQEGTKPSHRMPETWLTVERREVHHDPDIAQHLRLVAGAQAELLVAAG